jgi:hypothetical protein
MTWGMRQLIVAYPKAYILPTMDWKFRSDDPAAYDGLPKF